MKRLIVSAVLAILGCFFVVTSLSTLPKRGIAGLGTPVVRADGGCSNASLNGPYAVQGHGTIIAQLPNLPAPPFPFGEASIAHFNGAGTFFGNATLNLGGVVLAVPFTGIYAVNNDCTGNLTVNTNLGLTAHEAFVLIGGGQRYIGTETDPFAVVERTVERLNEPQN